MALVLLFITSPAEEVFWRGFIQRWFTHRFGGKAGWLLAVCVYAGVHVFSGNLMPVSYTHLDVYKRQGNGQ